MGKLDKRLLVCSSLNGRNWSEPISFSEASRSAPSLAAYHRSLWMAYLPDDKKTESKIQVYSSGNPNSNEWMRVGITNGLSTQAPSLAAFLDQKNNLQDKLWVGFVLASGEVAVQYVGWSRYWSPAMGTGAFSDLGPSLAVFEDKVWIASVDRATKSLEVALWNGDRVVSSKKLDHKSKAAPSLTVFDNRLWLSYVDDSAANAMFVLSSADGANWSNRKPVNQFSPATLSLCSRALYSGTILPKYQLVTVIYAPPGSASKSASSVEYGESSTLGTATSATKSFKSGTAVSMGVGFAGSSVSSDFGYETTGSNTTSVEVHKSKQYKIAVSGSDTNGIDHDDDVFVLWLNPQFSLSTDSSKEFLAELEVAGETMEMSHIYAGWLKHPATMPAAIKKRLDKAELNEKDYAEILSANPFVFGSDAIDRNRFLPTALSFPYTPPHTKDGPVIVKTYKVTNSIKETDQKAVEIKYSVGFTVKSGFKGVIEASFESKTSMEWTNTSLTESSKSSTQEATAVVSGPSWGYDGLLVDIRVYWDRLFSTFLFRFEDAAVLYSGRLTDDTGNPLTLEPVALRAGDDEFTTHTDDDGGFRFYRAEAAEGEVSARGKTFKVRLAEGQQAANLKV